MATAETTVDRTAAGSAAANREALSRIRERLVRPLPDDRLLGWLLPLAITALAGLIRIWRITRPGGHTLKSSGDIVFDETYYAHDSWSLLHHGVEVSNNGKGPGFVVHPPLAKWMMAVGEALFDHGKSVTLHGTIYPASPLSFRISGAVIGTLAVLLVARIARRMFRSTALGCVAGLLLSLDGMEFVQSRTGMLDIFLMFWVLAAFGCLVVDRDDGRNRLVEQLTAPIAPTSIGPFLGFRPWRWAAGLCLGAAAASKWDGAFYVPAFIILAFAWDVGARRTAGSHRAVRGALLADGLPSLLPFVVVPVAIYIASWTGWFLSNGTYAYDHDRYVHAGQSWFTHDRAVFGGWLRYQWEIWNFHNHLTWDANPHPYLSRSWGWLLLARPVAYYYQSPHGCGAATCSQEVLSIGTPTLWWAAIPSLLATFWFWLTRRDWRAGGILLVFAAGYLPWFREDAHHRVMFLFYMLPVVPFMVLAVTMCLGAIIGRVGMSVLRRTVGISVAATYLVIVTLTFGYFYPVLSAKTITYDQWHNRMWLHQCATHPNEHHENAPCWI